MSQRTQVLLFADVWKEISEGTKHIYQLQSMTAAAWMKLFT